MRLNQRDEVASPIRCHYSARPNLVILAEISALEAKLQEAIASGKRP
jgi:hypothetical protein